MNTYELHTIHPTNDEASDEIAAAADAQHIDLDSGDVIEIDRDGEPITVLVLLATDNALVLDALDGSTPFVVQASELGEIRKYEPAL